MKTNSILLASALALGAIARPTTNYGGSHSYYQPDEDDIRPNGVGYDRYRSYTGYDSPSTYSRSAQATNPGYARGEYNEEVDQYDTRQPSYEEDDTVVNRERSYYDEEDEENDEEIDQMYEPARSSVKDYYGSKRATVAAAEEDGEDWGQMRREYEPARTATQNYYKYKSNAEGDNEYKPNYSKMYGYEEEKDNAEEAEDEDTPSKDENERYDYDEPTQEPRNEGIAAEPKKNKLSLWQKALIGTGIAVAGTAAMAGVGYGIYKGIKKSVANGKNQIQGKMDAVKAAYNSTQATNGTAQAVQIAVKTAVKQFTGADLK